MKDRQNLGIYYTMEFIAGENAEEITRDHVSCNAGHRKAWPRNVLCSRKCRAMVINFDVLGQ